MALIDWVYQRWQHVQDLKMTRRELLDDLRRMEGDPRLAGRRKHLAEKLAQQRLSVELPTADVLVEVPGGAVIALKHNAQSNRTRVVGRGQDSLAARIREIAVTHKLPVVAERELTVSLYRSCKIGDAVPARLRQKAADICRTTRRTDND